MKLPGGVTRMFGRQLILAQKHAPAIFWTGGVACGIGATVSACRATLKLEPVIDKLENDLIRSNSMQKAQPEKYSIKNLNHDKLVFYTRAAGAICRLYGPAIILGAAAVTMLAKSNSILMKRNAGLTAAYTTLLQSLNDYRGRVREEFGEEKDREFLHGSHDKTIVEDTDKGPKKIQAKLPGDNRHSPYAKLFERGNQNWSPVPEYNLMFIRSHQNWLTDKLKARGHVFLNEAYDALGLERTPAGAVTGWIWDPRNEKNGTGGDGYVDFGVFDRENMDNFYRYVIGEEGAIWLDFNVDGEIWTRI